MAIVIWKGEIEEGDSLSYLAGETLRLIAQLMCLPVSRDAPSRETHPGFTLSKEPPIPTHDILLDLLRFSCCFSASIPIDNENHHGVGHPVAGATDATSWPFSDLSWINSHHYDILGFKWRQYQSLEAERQTIGLSASCLMISQYKGRLRHMTPWGQILGYGDVH